MCGAEVRLGLFRAIGCPIGVIAKDLLLDVVAAVIALLFAEVLEDTAAAEAGEECFSSIEGEEGELGEVKKTSF